ncbi:hypothetical protein [Flavobacterium sp.]|uniref:hypothetical protein n=1 Tax=Flavobacterium sp. TaxID=239 RepID=UPI00262C4439|nr:hypothetical protein [Flavobacterium sp.]
MASLKKSVMLSDQTQNYIAARQRSDAGDYSWSQGVNGAVSALQFILANSLPDFTEKEWLAILSCFNGNMYDDTRVESFLSLSSRMMDDVGAIDINELEASYREVVIKVHKLTVVEQYAVSDMCRKFWANKHENEQLLDIIEKLKRV